jgi:hypothetical protein
MVDDLVRVAGEDPTPINIIFDSSLKDLGLRTGRCDQSGIPL